MKGNRAARAKLRRAEKPEAVFLTEGFHMLWLDFCWLILGYGKKFAWSCCCRRNFGILDTDDNLSFAFCLCNRNRWANCQRIALFTITEKSFASMNSTLG